jgi:hypothetical protein
MLDPASSLQWRRVWDPAMTAKRVTMSALFGIVLTAVPLVGFHTSTWSPRPAADVAVVLAVVELPARVWADGKIVAAGRYDVRPATELPRFGEGQKPCGSCWMEFVRDGVSYGRERAIIVPEAEGERIANGPRPEPNRHRVDLFATTGYVQLWINRDGKDYIIRLPVAP